METLQRDILGFCTKLLTLSCKGLHSLSFLNDILQIIIKTIN